MSTVIQSVLLPAVALCLLLAAPASRAGDTVASNPAASNPFRVPAVDQDALARQRGGSDASSLADVKLGGAVTNNNASNLTTGSNVITDGALAGASGVPMVIQNSGNNVLIQSATIINVTVK